MDHMETAMMEYSPEFEQFEFGESEWSGEGEVFSEAELMELAGELMEVQSEAELDQFLGKIIKKVGRVVGKVARSPVGKAVGGVLKGVAKKALPIAGAAVGGYFGGPLGAKIGSGLATAAGGALGLEAEMLNTEDREFEGAKQFVRMSGQAVQSALTAPANMNPANVAQQAVLSAVAQHAPGLTGVKRPVGPSLSGGPGKTGRWVRKGRNIIILNA